MLEHCGITFSWGTEFGKGGPILAAKIGLGGPFLAADRFFRYRPIRVWDIPYVYGTVLCPIHVWASHMGMHA